MSDFQQYETSNLSYAAYLSMKKIKLSGIKGLNGQNGMATFVFTDTEETFQGLEIDYHNSECRDHNAAIGNLKMMVKQKMQRMKY